MCRGGSGARASRCPAPAGGLRGSPGLTGARARAMAGLEVEPGSPKQNVCLEGASEPSGQARVAPGARGGRPQVLWVGAGKTACPPPPDSNMAK